MARRTIYLPESVEALARRAAEGESFSATVTRLIEAGVRTKRGRRAPSYVATGDGPDDLGRMAKQYLRDLVSVRWSGLAGTWNRLLRPRTVVTVPMGSPWRW